MKIKKFVKNSFALYITSTTILSATNIAFAHESIPVRLDGEYLYTEAIKVDGNLLVREPSFNNSLGGIAIRYLNLLGEIEMISLEYNDITIWLEIDTYYAALNVMTNAFIIPVATRMIDDVVFVPLNFVAENFGFYVDFEDGVVLLNSYTSNEREIISQEPVTTQTVQPTAPVQVEPIQPVETPQVPVVNDRYAPFLYTQSQIQLPNRRLTEQERQEWIDEYWEMGGASAFELEILHYINIERTSRGLNALTWDDGLAMSARFYSQLVVNLGYSMGHRLGPYGGSFETARAFGVSANAANTAGGFYASNLVYRWMNSEGHRRNILNESARYFGAGSKFRGLGSVLNYTLFSSIPSSPVETPQVDDGIIPYGRHWTPSINNIDDWINGFNATELELMIFNRINEFREQNGLTSLPWSHNMAAGAALRTEYFVNPISGDIVGFGHDWGSFTSAELRNTIAGRTGGGINLTSINILDRSIKDLANEVVTRWSNSPGHRDTMLGNFNPDFMGIGSALNPNGTTLIVYMFMGRNS